MGIRRWLVFVLVWMVPGLAWGDVAVHPHQGPRTIELGEHLAKLDLPAGFFFIDKAETVQLLQGAHVTPSGQELGMLGQTAKNSDYLVVIRYDDAGHIADDDAGAMEPDLILASIRTTAQRLNPLQHVDGWEERPSYDPGHHLLTWALTVTSASRTVNYNTRLLTRTGALAFNLLADPDRVDADLKPGRSLTDRVTLLPGQRYEDFVAGDRTAGYGLVGLMVGGRAAEEALRSHPLGTFWTSVRPWIGLAGVLLLIWWAVRRRKVAPGG